MLTLSCTKPPAPLPDCTPHRPIDRTCATDADCVVVTQQTSCCGDAALRGINRTDAARFEADEKICSRDGHPCKCIPRPTTLDFGTWVPERRGGAGAVSVSCREKLCTSFSAPPSSTP